MDKTYRLLAVDHDPTKYDTDFTLKKAIEILNGEGKVWVFNWWDHMQARRVHPDFVDAILIDNDLGYGPKTLGGFVNSRKPIAYVSAFPVELLVQLHSGDMESGFLDPCAYTSDNVMLVRKTGGDTRYGGEDPSMVDEFYNFLKSASV